ncbi:MAG: hypothetical protein WCI26_13505 [Acidimicrobiales bacterium]
MESDLWSSPGIRMLSPEEHATLVANDRHLASQVYHYCAVGDTPDALRIITDEANEILARCSYMTVNTPIGQHTSLDLTIRSIDEVATRCWEQGDAVQVSWCEMLNQELIAGR